MKRTRPEAVRQIVAKQRPDLDIAIVGGSPGMTPETAAALRELIAIGRKARMSGR